MAKQVEEMLVHKLINSFAHLVPTGDEIVIFHIKPKEKNFDMASSIQDPREIVSIIKPFLEDIERKLNQHDKNQADLPLN